MGAAGFPRDPHPREHLAAFPGRVAAASTGMGLGSIAAVGTDRAGDEPWAVDVTYRSPTGSPRLVIKTVRSPHGLSPRGLPVENAEVQLLRFLGGAGGRERGLVVPSRESSAANHARVRAAVTDAPAAPVDVVIDSDLVPATRIDALGAVVITASWHDQAVFLTGTPEHLGTLELHTATSADVDHL